METDFLAASVQRRLSGTRPTHGEGLTEEVEIKTHKYSEGA
ncbi:MAG: hypothetical protein M0Z79_08040 [Nitrospiraceae bacterium]|nr:hypothetical protein [Nitrospiraceae bacterium]